MQINKPFYATLGSRFLALVIDFLLLSAVFLPVTRIIKGTWLMSPADHQWRVGWFVSDPLCLTFLLAVFVYFVLLEGILGFTVGKALLALRVISTDGTVPGIGKSLIRNLLRLIDGLPALNILGVILILTSPEGARYGDRIARTRVIKTPQQASMESRA